MTFIALHLTQALTALLPPFHMKETGIKGHANADVECRASNAARLLQRSFPVEAGYHLSSIINVPEPHIRAWY